ncbi:hypothetical protein BDV96DRAFT_565311 [Lophiotrema nucula]|uniref:DNA-directed RNA polymerase subunit n=1 Tax=Lophiotrema nucula TaxID=690887 RepID=A0A6A5ZM05_9PLEO|nr:hypothetical protein BDV96DRAFT_565311 [Lophiotrema nucula]
MAPIASEQSSLLHIERIAQYISLPPACLATPLPSVCASVFSPLLLSYCPPARGIVLAYQNVQLTDSPPRTAAQIAQIQKEKSRKRKRREERHYESASDSDSGADNANGEGNVMLGKVIDEYSGVFLWATADLLVWRPEKGVWIEGKVMHQSSSHITLSYLNTFSVSVLKQHLPAGYAFSSYSNTQAQRRGGAEEVGDAEGFWCDDDGMPLEDVVSVRIRDFGFGSGGKGKGFVRVEGSMVSEEEEKRREGAGKDKAARKAGRAALKRAEQSSQIVEVE